MADPYRGAAAADRLRGLARAGLAGFGLGAGGVLAATAAGVPVREANAVAFPLAALVFGVGVAAWASVLLYGRTLERGLARVDRGADVSRGETAAAMGTVAVLGLAAMVGATVATGLVSALAG